MAFSRNSSIFIACLALVGVFAAQGAAAQDTECLTPVDILFSANYTLLATALDAAELIDTLDTTTHAYTIFAPSDAAIAASLASLGITPEQFMEDTKALQKIMKTHILRFGKERLSAGEQLQTEKSNQLLTINTCGDGMCVKTANEVTVIDTDPIVACKSYIYAIDGVLLPRDALKQTSMSVAGR